MVVGMGLLWGVINYWLIASHMALGLAGCLWLVIILLTTNIDIRSPLLVLIKEIVLSNLIYLILLIYHSWSRTCKILLRKICIKLKSNGGRWDQDSLGRGTFGRWNPLESAWLIVRNNIFTLLRCYMMIAVYILRLLSLFLIICVACLTHLSILLK